MFRKWLCGFMLGLMLAPLAVTPELRAQSRGANRIPAHHSALQNKTLYNIRQRSIAEHGRSPAFVSQRGRHYGAVGRGMGYGGFNRGFRGGFYGGFYPGWGLGCFGPLGPIGFSYFSYGYGPPYGIYYSSGVNQVDYYLPPIYAPAELNYGPLAVDRFLGLHREGQLAAAEAARADQAEAQLRAIEQLVQPAVHREPAQIEPRQSNETARQRAGRFVEFGDALFVQQRYHEAQQRYRTASEAAPDLELPFLRQGFALLATQRYELAVDAFQRAIALNRQGELPEFRLDELYGENQIAKNGHLEDVARAALDAPQNSDLFFLVGIFLHYDGQAERAKPFFRRCADAAGADSFYLRPFLPPEAPPEVPEDAEQAPHVPAEPAGRAGNPIDLGPRPVDIRT